MSDRRRAPGCTVDCLWLPDRAAARDLVTEQREGKWVYYRLSDEDPNAALLRFVLVLVASDPQVGQDAALARRLNGTSPDIVCASAAVDVEAPDSSSGV